MLETFAIGPVRALRWMLAGLAICTTIVSARAGPSLSANTNFASRLVEYAGKVEITIASTNDWQPARLSQWLYPGDRLRTAADSRATLQLSDRSVIRVSESTILEIQPPAPPARHRFGLKRGALFFLDREQPADIEFETRMESAVYDETTHRWTVT